jgi:hypothetical protein
MPLVAQLDTLRFLFRQACEFLLEGPGLEAPRSPISRRPVAALGEGEESGVAGDEPREGCVLMKTVSSTWIASPSERPPERELLEYQYSER